MQVTLKNRETLNGVITIKSNPVDVGDNSVISVMLLVYAISGAGATLAIQFEMSNDLENWVNLGSSFNLGTATSQTVAYTAAPNQFQRYFRASIALSGTTPLVSYSLWANLFPSS